MGTSNGMPRLIHYAKSISFRPPYRSLGFRSDGVPSVRLVLTFVGQAGQLVVGLSFTGEAEYWPCRCSLWFHPSDGQTLHNPVMEGLPTTQQVTCGVGLPLLLDQSKR